MPTIRSDFYLIALPDGNILAVGGVQGPPGLNGTPVYTPTLYKPDAPTGERWTELEACMAVRRVHHSAAVLLWDGSIFICGGDYGEPDGGGTDIFSYQVYKPPYFFDASGNPASRPQILSVGGDTTDPTSVDSIRIIRLGAATHSFDQNQRSVQCDILPVFGAPSGQTHVKVKMPLHGNIAPPGYYMMFVVENQSGRLIPSEAWMIHLTATGP